MYIFIALLAFIAYVVSTRVTFKALCISQSIYPRPSRNHAIYGITGMIVSGFVLGSALEHLL